MTFAIEFEMEDDGRWIAEMPELPGVMAYGGRQAEARARVEALALRVLADRIEAETLSIETIFVRCGMTRWPATKAAKVYRALLRSG